MNHSYMLWRLARSANPRSRYDRFFGNLLVYTLAICVVGWLAVFGVAAVSVGYDQLTKGYGAALGLK